MATEPKTLEEAIERFEDPDFALAYVAKLRWPKGPVCPACGADQPSFLSTRRLWKCRSCAKQFSVKVGTIFEDSPVGLEKWLPALWMASNGGINSCKLARAIGVTQKTAWLMGRRIKGATAAAQCAAPGCDLRISAKGLCKAHYQRLKRGIDLSVPLDANLTGKWERPAPKEKGQCSVESCLRVGSVKGLCYLHYNRARTGGPPAAAPIRERVTGGKPCRVDGCGRKSRAGGLCNAHYMRQLNGLEVDRPLLSAKRTQECSICGTRFNREKTSYCSRVCAEEAWARGKSRIPMVRFYATRQGSEAEEKMDTLFRAGYRQAIRAQGGTKPGLFTLTVDRDLYRIRWYEKDDLAANDPVRHHLGAMDSEERAACLVAARMAKSGISLSAIGLPSPPDWALALSHEALDLLMQDKELFPC